MGSRELNQNFSKQMADVCGQQNEDIFRNQRRPPGQEPLVDSALTLMTTFTQVDTVHGFGSAWLDYSKTEEQFVGQLRNLMLQACPLVEKMVKALSIRGAVTLIAKMAANEGPKDKRWFLLCLALLAVVCAMAAFTCFQASNLFNIFMQWIAPSVQVAGGWSIILTLVCSALKFLVQNGDTIVLMIKRSMMFLQLTPKEQ